MNKERFLALYEGINKRWEKLWAESFSTTTRQKAFEKFAMKEIAFVYMAMENAFKEREGDDV